jgi:hypothetical protein
LGYSEGVIPKLAKANVIVKSGNRMGKWVLHRAQKTISVPFLSGPQKCALG